MKSCSTVAAVLHTTLLTIEQLLTLYQAQVRSCMEYCSHLWDGSAKYQLDALDSVDRRARRLIGDLANKKLQSLYYVARLPACFRCSIGYILESVLKNYLI
ncbi:jg6548 [Pararge aegeria aegeria]|uniref:Jg6548 protein n=1 Tax=Pararge aegeria aegeria TaxID=348720 RepID=A0A8S4S5G0_9NEOP|nr:jg6548 [Pararge aegeria aegeria]